MNRTEFDNWAGDYFAAFPATLQWINEKSPDMSATLRTWCKTLEHITKFSFDPETTAGNIEHLTGVAQIPIGIAGPMRVRGEYAEGDFVVPLATTEGTLVASYNRGIKVLNLSGGVKCTVQDDCMQRAPVFVFENSAVKCQPSRSVCSIGSHALPSGLKRFGAIFGSSPAAARFR